jgi:hypothetical protein
MFTNFALRRDVLTGIEGFDVFSDMMYLSESLHLEGNRLFREFDKEIPNSRFILNTRDKDRWISSRSRHSGKETGSLLNRACVAYGKEESEVHDIWARQWDRHHEDVQDYFRPFPEKLLTFNIEIDPIERVTEFLEDKFTIDPSHWEWRNKTNLPV